MKRISEDVRKQILEGSLIHAMLAIAVPVIMNSLIQTCYNLTDTYWLGKVGTDALAAINLVTPVQNIVINFGSGISVAGSVLISQYLGAGKKDQANRMASQVFSCALIFSCACAGLICLATPVLVGWLGAEGGVLNAGISYLRIVILDMPFLFTVNVFQAVSQSRGNTVRPMLINLTGVLINMALDPLLMSVLNLGATGAALATVGAKAAAASIAFAALVSRRGELRLKREELRPRREQLGQIVHIGLPTALGSSMMQFGFLLMSRTVLTYGSQAMAAYGIGNKLNGLISMPSNAMGSDGYDNRTEHGSREAGPGAERLQDFHRVQRMLSVHRRADHQPAGCFRRSGTDFHRRPDGSFHGGGLPGADGFLGLVQRVLQQPDRAVPGDRTHGDHHG